MEFLDPSINYPDEIKIKVIIVGKCQTGKTAFSLRLKAKNYSDFKILNKPYLSTVGFEFYSEKIKIKNKIIHLQLWDTTGQELYQSILFTCYKDTSIFFIFYDAFDKDSFKRAKSFYEDIKNLGITNPIYVLIRSKYEIALDSNDKKNIVTDEEALEYAEKNNLLFFHLGIFEKYETGIIDLMKFALYEYLKRNNI